jgi:poly-beta-1,6-N-acetyl-D-glucosamine synthase
MGAQSLQFLFWISALLIAYTYLLYPLAVVLLARMRRRSQFQPQVHEGSFSIILAVHNEESMVLARIDELTRLINGVVGKGELVVVSDGSTDNTLPLARSRTSPTTRIVELNQNVGKAAALSRGCALATGDVLVFADVRQRWHEAALKRLLNNFSSLEVGAVSGELVLESDIGVLAGVGLYWRYEKWLRRNEALVHSTVGVAGSISAVRRQLFMPIPAGTLLDDVYWPMQVVMQGSRVVYDESAIAYDRLPANAGGEFRRKVRTLSGNFQIVARLPQLLLPWRNPIFVQFVSHKLLRLAVPWALLTALVSSMIMHSGIYLYAAGAQLAFYAAGVASLVAGGSSKSRVLSAAGSFIVLNAAAAAGLLVWLSGNAGSSWKRSHYSGVSQ